MKATLYSIATVILIMWGSIYNGVQSNPLFHTDAAPSEDSVVTDRNGNIYPIKKLLDSTLWMTANLKLNIPDSYCYENNPANCEQFGRLYTWTSAQLACAMLGEEWRLPSNDEWKQLAMRRGGFTEESPENRKKAYSALVGGITEFNAELGGGRRETGEYARINAHGFYWTSTPTDSINAWFSNFGKGSMSLYHQSDGDKLSAFAVRCVKSTGNRD